MSSHVRLDSLFLLLLLLATASDNSSGTTLFTSSSNNITEGGTITLNCSSNNSLVFINWVFNGTVSAVSVRRGVTATGIGTSSSSLTVPGIPYPFNNTIIKCVLFIPGSGELESPPPVMLRIQGRLEAPYGLAAVQSNDSCCYRLNWFPPFTLPGVPILGYNINVTNNDNGADVLQINVSNTTQWEYCPGFFGNNNVNIAAVNDVGEGQISTVDIKTEEYKISLVEVIAMSCEAENCRIVIKITPMQPSILFNCINSVLLESATNDVIYATNFISNSTSGILLATFNVSDQSGDGKMEFNVSILHANGLESMKNKILISFFDSHCQSSIASVGSSPTVFPTVTASAPDPSNKGDAGIIAIISSSVVIAVLLLIIVIFLTVVIILGCKIINPCKKRSHLSSHNGPPEEPTVINVEQRAFPHVDLEDRTTNLDASGTRSIRRGVNIEDGFGVNPTIM